MQSYGKGGVNNKHSKTFNIILGVGGVEMFPSPVSLENAYSLGNDREGEKSSRSEDEGGSGRMRISGEEQERGVELDARRRRMSSD